jgi:mono/diheme cytochrome c family protein
MDRKIISSLALIILILAVCGIAAGQSGADVFSTRCASCHGTDGAGTPNANKTFQGMPDLRTTIAGMTDAHLFETIARGVDHKKYPHRFLQTGLTTNQVADVVVHLRKLAKK